MGKELRPYQIEDLAFYIRNPRCANLSDPGTGKTPSACLYAFWLWTRHQQRTVWVMPKSLLEKNRDELLDFTKFTCQDLMIIDGTPKQRAKQIRSEAKVFLMGFQRWADDWRTFLDLYPDIGLLMVDEMHMGYSSNKANRTQELYLSMHRIPRFLAMTGTLIKGRLDSAYPTIHIIEPRYYLNWTAFYNQHAILDWFGHIEGWQGHEKIEQILARHSVRHSFTEIHGKAPIVMERRLCHMDLMQRKVYTEFHENAMLELEDGNILDGSMPGVNVIRARQIMAHPEQVKLPIEHDNEGKVIAWKTYQLIKGARTGKDEVMEVDLIDHQRNGEPFVIFAVFQREQERILDMCKKMGLKVALINGNVSSAERSRIDKAFRTGELQGLVCSDKTAGVGFNWGHCDHFMFASLSYEDDAFMQALYRALRGTRTTPLRVTLYEYRQSVDQRIFSVVEAKSRLRNLVDNSYDVLALSELATG